ncbi:hypothetical protein BT96DRAFT_914713 [Gymnopus androsaceus JB14]|uniref:Uncharacterized protein n=1 Tax=Gymnopus androsaceus JB14 TaxID=1447944 RepID=A0A6A4IC95_9AGAR|nr:hypothetical protein BT96DRAFT_914713 [Gymnopus androsaceus JB14]
MILTVLRYKALSSVMESYISSSVNLYSAMEDNTDIPIVCFTFEPNSLLNTSVYRHAQSVSTGFLKLSESHTPAYIISSTNTIGSTHTVFKDASKRVLAEINRKDLAKDTIAFRDGSQDGDKLMKAARFREWLENEFGFVMYSMVVLSPRYMAHSSGASMPI